MAATMINAECVSHNEYDDFFEGPEKTLFIEFKPTKLSGSLRAKPQEVWSEVLRESGVTIVSKLCPVEPKDKGRSRECTAYLLSESSLFVYDNRVILKTCGRTSPLRALPALMDLAKTKDAEKAVMQVAYSRPTLFRAKEQMAPHQTFDQEIDYLQTFFPSGEGYALGGKKRGVDVFLANYAPASHFSTWVQAEVYVTQLGEHAMKTFAKGTTAIPQFWANVCPSKGKNDQPAVDEFYFEPYGYSANVLQRAFYYTTHATPQPSCSYFSAATNAPLTGDELAGFVREAANIGRGAHVDVFLLASSPELALPFPKLPGMTVSSKTCMEGQDFSLRHCSFTIEPTPAPEPMPTLSSRDVYTVARSALEEQAAGFDRPVMLMDSAQLGNKLAEWKRSLPRVKPHYAVKCNPAPVVVNAMCRLQDQPGFDCASEAEMRMVTSFGAKPENIVYSNPCKQVSSIAFAKSLGVKRVVFDNAGELAKLADAYPEAELLIRVQTDDTDSQCPMSMKFGCPVEQCTALLEEAKTRGMTVTGVMFHVGSGCGRKGAFEDAIGRAKQVAEAARALGHPISLLDIGGGFPGSDSGAAVTFADMAEEIARELATHFDDSYEVIAEPGRFFVHSAGALLCQVMAKAPLVHKEGEEEKAGFRYYLNDGVYGSFNCLVYDHAEVTKGPFTLDDATDLRDEAGSECAFFGPTCDGFDALFKQACRRELKIGEWLIFPEFGAYTNAAATSFNGFQPPLVHLF